MRNTTDATHVPFIAAGWLKLTDDEQEEMVRPFYGEYLARLDQIQRNGAYPYNDSFKGHLPSIDPAKTGTTEKDEGTAIYLLQELHSREGMRGKVAEFIESGGRPITVEDVADGKILRGTVARYGWYSGGTGWQVYENVRVLSSGGRFPRLAALPKGRRVNGYDLSGGRVLFKEGAK